MRIWIEANVDFAEYPKVFGMSASSDQADAPSFNSSLLQPTEHLMPEARAPQPASLDQ
jgi:hypothetical protein